MKDARGKERAQFQTVNDGPVLVHRSLKDQADIKHILGKYKEFGILPELNRTQGSFADVTELQDYAEVFRITAQAKEEFMKLPPRVRRIFNNDVANWLDTAHDENKRDELVAAGYLEAPPEVVPEGAGGGEETTETEAQA